MIALSARLLYLELWKREMQEHERERQQWDHEREAHRPYWDQPVRVSLSCSAYGTMEYKARLWNVPPGSDWYQACIGMAQQIHGRTLEKPDRCEDLVSAGPSNYRLQRLQSRSH